MKRTIALILVIAMAMALVFASGSTESSSTAEEKTFTLRMADNQANGTPNVRGDEKFIELVDKYTNGTVKIEDRKSVV